jgi:hypothetical protein
VRTYYRTTGGVDGAVQTLLFWGVVLTAPVWVPVAIVLAGVALYAETHPPERSPICVSLFKARDAANLQHNTVEAVHLSNRLIELGCFK